MQLTKNNSEHYRLGYRMAEVNLTLQTNATKEKVASNIYVTDSKPWKEFVDGWYQASVDLNYGKEIH